jgi:hypothetical protein
MQLNYEEILDKANARYATAWSKRSGIDISYMAPEQLPKIESEQVKCVLRALVEASNDNRG